jgi:hypothetical protein
VCRFCTNSDSNAIPSITARFSTSSKSPHGFQSPLCTALVDGGHVSGELSPVFGRSTIKETTSAVIALFGRHIPSTTTALPITCSEPTSSWSRTPPARFAILLALTPLLASFFHLVDLLVEIRDPLVAG